MPAQLHISRGSSDEHVGLPMTLEDLQLKRRCARGCASAAATLALPLVPALELQPSASNLRKNPFSPQLGILEAFPTMHRAVQPYGSTAMALHTVANTASLSSVLVLVGPFSALGPPEALAGTGLAAARTGATPSSCVAPPPPCVLGRGPRLRARLQSRLGSSPRGVRICGNGRTPKRYASVIKPWRQGTPS